MWKEILALRLQEGAAAKLHEEEMSNQLEQYTENPSKEVSARRVLKLEKSDSGSNKVDAKKLARQIRFRVAVIERVYLICYQGGHRTHSRS